VVEWLPAQLPGSPHPRLPEGGEFTVFGGAPAFFDALTRAFAARGLLLRVGTPSTADVVIVAHGLGGPDAVHDTFTDLSGLASRSAPPSVLVHVSDTSRAGAGAAGVVKTAGREWQSDYVCCTVSDVTRAAELVADELAFGAGEREVRYTPERAVLARVEAPFSGAKRPVPAGPWIVSGGARGVTAACCVALAKAGMKQVVLLGRSALTEEPEACRNAVDEGALKRALLGIAVGKPNLAAIAKQAKEILAQREVRGNIAAMEAAGCTVRYASVDVTDTTAVRALVADVSAQWGPVRGLVHAAGVLADKRLGDKTLEQFDWVLRTKMDGGTALLEACADQPLEVLCFFSSVAAHSGNAGQSDYAAANAMLDHWAATERAARGEACRVMSIAWGPWDGGMVDASLAKHFTARGIGLIPLQGGAQAMVDEIERGRHAQIIVGCGLDDGDLPRPATLRWSVAATPQLVDHSINGQVVLPMTFALDALLGIGRRVLGPEVSLHELRLFQGAVLQDGAIDLAVSTELLAPDTVRVTFTHTSGRPAYRATLRRGAATLPVPAVPAPAAVLPAVCAAPYEASLFHGPAFAVIRDVLTCDEAGTVARFATRGALGWAGGWQLDPVALDGALQLLRVWGWAQDGRPSLPTAIEAVEIGVAWPADGEVLCHLTATREQGTRLLADATFTDVDGRVTYARLRGIQMHTQAS
jgi:NAD(P)-dependent dehydrogenase (short-subunit alcohol dehydrogenase family)